MRISPVSFRGENYSIGALTPLHDYGDNTKNDRYSEYGDEARIEEAFIERGFGDDGLSGCAHFDEYGSWQSKEVPTVPLTEATEITTMQKRDQALKQEVSDVLSSIGSEQEQAVRMRYLQGATHREVAEELGISETTARARSKEGLARLRSILAQRGYKF